MSAEYQNPGPSRDEIDAASGPLLLEFGVDWCPHCQAAAPAVEQALADHATVRHVKVEDGKGRPLGRSFGVKLWPTLIALKDGAEAARVVRPTTVEQVQRVLAPLG